MRNAARKRRRRRRLNNGAVTCEGQLRIPRAVSMLILCESIMKLKPLSREKKRTPITTPKTGRTAGRHKE